MAASPPVCEFGWPAPGFELSDTTGKRWTRDSLRGPNGMLIMFICNHCPFVKSIVRKLVREGNDLKKLGIGVAAVCSNDARAYPEDSFENMVRFAEVNGFPFPYLHDPDQRVAEAYGAVCTPDFFGFNGDLQLQYRGRLDGAGRKDDMGAPRELYAAFQQIADTGAGPKEQVASIGCSIKWIDE